MKKLSLAIFSIFLIINTNAYSAKLESGYVCISCPVGPCAYIIEAESFWPPQDHITIYVGQSKPLRVKTNDIIKIHPEAFAYHTYNVGTDVQIGDTMVITGNSFPGVHNYKLSIESGTCNYGSQTK